MVAITQEDLPYIVLTEDPNLQAYRTDRIATSSRSARPRTGDLICEQVSYEGLLALEPRRGRSDDDDGGRRRRGRSRSSRPSS